MRRLSKLIMLVAAPGREYKWSSPRGEVFFPFSVWSVCSKGKAAAAGRLVKRDCKPFVAQYYPEPLVHSYLFQVCLQPARHVDPGWLCWEGILGTFRQTGSIDTIRFPSQWILCFWLLISIGIPSCRHRWMFQRCLMAKGQEEEDKAASYWDFP